MNNSKSTLLSIIVLCLSCATANALQVKPGVPELSGLGLDFEPDRSFLNINLVSMQVLSNGVGRTDQRSGVIYPRGTAGVVFTDGIVWGGEVLDGAGPEIRVGGQTFSSGVVPGVILGPGLSENFRSPEINRVWRIRRGYFTADLRADAADVFAITPAEVGPDQIEALRAAYRLDWQEWPWQKGAPFYDADGDGVYSPEFRSDDSPVHFPEADQPGLANADQVIWFVTNDLEDEAVRLLHGSPPIGLEVQTTLWAYEDIGPLENIIFKRYRLIYKGDTDTPDSASLRHMAISQWSDPDVGWGADDLAGCDTTLDLGYSYNGDGIDSEFSRFQLPPPAVGYDLLAGPVVPAPGREAVFDFQKRTGLRHLRMTTFSFFGSGIDNGSDPIRGGNYDGTLQWWNMLRGYRSRPIQPPVPLLDETGRPTRFVFSGDPVAGTGFIDRGLADRRIYWVSGPFDMALGDTNEIHVALVAGLGTDRLQSISAMRFYARYGQSLFTELFNIPIAPSVEVSGTELAGAVRLNWSQDQSQVARIEQTRTGQFEFEGYNIYQLPAADAALSAGVRLATFDVRNEVRTILQEEFDMKAGLVLSRPAQFGTNSGILRTFSVNRDSLHSEPLYNGQDYFFAVTAYYYNPDPVAGIKIIESAPSVVRVRPQDVKPGLRLTAAVGDTLRVSHVEGNSRGRVLPIVTDPMLLTGDEYRLSFREAQSGSMVWSLSNVSRAETILDSMMMFEAGDDFLTVEGFRLKVIGMPLEGIAWRSEGEVWLTAGGPSSPGGLVFGGAYLGSNFSGSSLSKSDFRDTHWEWFPKAGFTDLNSNNQYDVGEPYQMAEGDGHQKAFMTDTWGGSYEGFFDVPFAVFDSEVDPPRQLNVHVRDRDQNRQWDLDVLYGPGDPNAVDINGGDFRFNYIFVAASDYDASGRAFDPTQGGVDFFANVLDGGQPVYWVGWFGPGSVAPLSMSFSFDLIAPRDFTSEDVYTFSSPAPTFDLQLARDDALTAVNVFPNPCLGPFDRSTRFPKGFVTFSHLPEKATVRIYTLAGTQVVRLQKDDSSQFLVWDLKNASGRGVASGVYVAHVEMPALGVSKNLKMILFR